MRYIRSKDLNLLMVFQALWQERNVTKAALAIGCSQPSLSRALARLRHDLGDPLFVRVPGGMAPTNRAKEIAESVCGSLDIIEKVYSPTPSLDLKKIEQVVTVATSDYFEVIAAVKLIPALTKAAPGLSINFRNHTGAIPKAEMERGEIDLVVSGLYEGLPEGFYQQSLLVDHYRSARSKNAYSPTEKVEISEFVSLRHVLVTPKGDLHGAVDAALAKLKKSRKVAIGSSHFLSAGLIAAESDLILTAPGLIIENMKKYLPLLDFPTPVKIPPLKLLQVWHGRSQRDPLLKWFRQFVKTNIS